MSRIRANTITNQNANGAPNFPDGITVTGVVTATTTSQNITGDLTVSGNIGVGGTLTYEDVTNIDSIGIITARSSINVNAASSGIGVTINSGGINVAGVITATSFSGIDSDKISEGNTEAEVIDTGSDGHFKVTTEGSERLRIDSNGNTLVNVNTATAGSYTYKLLTSDNISSSEQTFGVQYPSVVTYGLNAESNADFTIKKDGVERLRINTHGLVTALSQYHLHADRTGNQTGYNAGGDFGTPMIFNQIVTEHKASSLSSCLNTSNGLFTAPVTGLYLFNASVYGASGNIFSQSWFTLNGARGSGTDWVINSGYSFVQNTQVIRLSAGNTVGFKPYAGGQSNVTLNANPNHTYFKVTLIG